ncbi:hypothetical protein, partial [Escherichia coli]|uniref:hypothetical protein n=1 Tax=Escherichia coli TaxID=562 RepID=UPI001AA10558
NGMQEAILQALTNASESVYNMRVKEGKELQNDLASRINAIYDIVSQLDDRKEIVIMEYMERMKQRLEEYAEDKITNDESKVLHEV